MSSLLKKQSVINVKKFFENINENLDLIVLDETARTAKDAACSLNKEVGAIIKSLIFQNNLKNEYYLCLVSGDKFTSLKKLSNIVGQDIIKADAGECKKLTGYSIGGVSPVAHKQNPSRIFIDSNLKRYKSIFAAAGHPYVVFGISFDNLCKITNGEVISIVE